MTPTAKLRFVEREQATGQMITHRKILQQWWENRNMRLAVKAFDEYGTPIARYQGEWRDIPTETEDFTQKKTSG
jgi:hypothetical protein